MICSMSYNIDKNNDRFKNSFAEYNKAKQEYHAELNTFMKVSNEFKKEVEKNGDKTERAIKLGNTVDLTTLYLDKLRREYNLLAHQTLEYLT